MTAPEAPKAFSQFFVLRSAFCIHPLKTKAAGFRPPLTFN
jgi:hypothetical protein